MYILESAKKKFSEEILNTLRVESLVLSRCIYRMSLQFRGDKGFKYMQKTNSLLKKLLNFNILKDFNYFYYSVPQKYDKDMYLPTRQMLEYLLVRLQGYSQLSSRVVESAQTTAEFMRGRLVLGHLWVTAAVNLSLASRIWQLCKNLTEHCCVLYDDLLPLREKLIPLGQMWLKQGYVFPEELKVWLDMDWLKEQPDIISHIQLERPIFTLINDDDDDEVEFCYQYKLDDFITVEDDDEFNDDDVEIIAKYTAKSRNNSIEIINQKNKDFIVPDSDSSCDIGVAVKLPPKRKKKNKKMKKTVTINLISPITPHVLKTQPETQSAVVTNITNSSNSSPNKKTKKKTKKQRLEDLNAQRQTPGTSVSNATNISKGSPNKKRKKSLSPSKTKLSPSKKKRKKSRWD